MMYYVYRLDNHTLRETYFGVTNDPNRRISEHCAGDTVALEHWSCARHRITISLGQQVRTQGQASAIAHECERTGSTAPAGYNVIQTAGV